MEWNQLGVAATIYEEDEEDDDRNSCSSAQSLGFVSSPSPNQQISRFKSWNYLAMPRKYDFPPDVVIHVQDTSFGLHKEALIARSTFFKRQLSESPELTLSPPLNITAQTFSLVTDFCYGNRVVITPLNVAALRTAAELLGMTEIADSGDDNLLQMTEEYFRSVIAANSEYASIVLKSCFELLPEAETAASLVSRCIAPVSSTVDGDLRWLDEVKRLGIGDLQLVLEALSRRLSDCHDFLYRIVDAYLKANIGTISDDQKIKMCNYIDCSILSPNYLMHAVQNPRMPMRFIVQAMFVEQLSTRASIITAADHHLHKKHDRRETITLGAILQRDAALRQVSQLKNIMTATNTRIQTLEKELSMMKTLLKESESIKNRVDHTRSASFRFGSESNRIARGQVGSISALSYRDAAKKVTGQVFSPSEGSSDGNPIMEKNLGQRLMMGIKSVFRFQRKKCELNETLKKRESIDNKKFEPEDSDNIVVIKKDEVACHHNRSRSHSSS